MRSNRVRLPLNCWSYYSCKLLILARLVSIRAFIPILLIVDKGLVLTQRLPVVRKLCVFLGPLPPVVYIEYRSREHFK